MSVNESLPVVIAAAAVFYGTPLLYASLGEVLAERSGVLNLGVEGMMLIGAVCGFGAVQVVAGPGWLALGAAVLCAAAAGAAVALIHGVLAIGLRANQIVSGLALAIFAGGSGLSSYIGNAFRLGGHPAHHEFSRIDVLGLAKMPVLGPILFHQNALVYLSWLVVAAATVYVSRSRLGLNLRAVGESPETADAAGISVAAYRYVHTLVGGALAGLGGAFYSLAITPAWIDGMTSGAGWIAIALVVFAFWRPELAVVGAYLFGALSSLTFVLQTGNVHVAPEVFAALPFVITIVVLAAVSSGWARRRLGAPAALGVPYVREAR
jgi:simple sugar transport system permease protein